MSTARAALEALAAAELARARARRALAAAGHAPPPERPARDY